jgi:hypothetical protein
MAFNLLIDSKNNTQFPNPLIIDPDLDFFYTFNSGDLSGNVLKNQGITQAYDLTINSGVVNGEFTGDPLEGTISSSLTLTSAGYSVGCWFSVINTTSSFLFSFQFDTTQNSQLFFFVSLVGGTFSLTLRDSVNINTLNGGNNVIFTGIVVNQLYHFVYVNKGTSWDIYKDGVFLLNLAGKTPSNSVAKTINYIGRSSVEGANPFEGTTDGLFIIQKQLTASQILAIYQAGLRPITSNFYYTIPIQPYTYTYANNALQYWFDFYTRPSHPHGTNRYRVYSSFISYGEPYSPDSSENQMSYYVIDGLGNVNNRIGTGGNPAVGTKTNQLIKNITFKRTLPQKWVDFDPTLPFIIENINDTGILNVEIRLIENNNLSTDVGAFGANATGYLIQLLFEPI